MGQRVREQLTDRLVTDIQDLPTDKMFQVIDFVGYLRTKYSLQSPQRGSAEAILQAVEQVGSLQFEPGELDTLLADIQSMREMDMEDYG